jgi:dihydroorotate dehydrogenase electron transfer subunit
LESAFTEAGGQVHCTTEDGSYGTQGLVTVAVEKVILASDVDMVYACGPVGMLSALAKLCQTYRLDYQLSWEAHMRCGMGLCGSCEVPQEFDPALPVGWLACYDGPVYAHHWE